MKTGHAWVAAEIVRGLLAQGRPSVGVNGCAYRATAPDGTVLKCAVGMLIPDEKYSRRMEDTYCLSPVVRGALPSMISPEADGMIVEFQKVHDSWADDGDASLRIEMLDALHPEWDKAITPEERRRFIAMVTTVPSG